MITVLKPGVLTSVQDAGRPGYRAFGMPLAGAVDAHAYAIANLLARNIPGAAALEMTLLGATLRFERPAHVGIAGAEMGATLDGQPVAGWASLRVEAGAELAFGSARDGCRTYLAVHGGIDVPPVLGSRSTYTRAQVGGLQGRPLRRDDVLPLAAAAARDELAPVRLGADLVPRYGRTVRLRVVPGPQDDRFEPAGLATFLGEPYTVSNRNDRMAYQLDGPAIRHLRGPDIVSDAVIPGSIQVPGSGRPIVMMADCATVGGYAKIATALSADLPRLAQARTGDEVRFERCGVEEGIEALRAERERLAAVAAAIGRGGT